MQIAGLHKEGSEFQVACLGLKEGQITIERLEKNDLPFPYSKETLVVTGIEGQDLLIRHLKSPLKKMNALHKTLPFQLEALIPYSLDEVVVKPIYIHDEKETQGTFFTVSKKSLEKHLDDYQADGIDPDWVSVVPMALFRFGQFTCPQESSLVIFHIGHTQTQLVSVKEGMVQSHLTLHIGKRDFLQAFDRDKTLQLVNVKEKTAPNLFELLARYRREVDRAFCFLAHKEDEESVRNVLFCGEMADQVEASLLESGAFRFSPLKIIEYDGFDAEMLRHFAISIGLCLDALKNDQKSIQLRQGEYISEPRLKGIKKGLMKGGMIAAMLLVLTAFYSYVFFEKKEKQFSKQLESLAMEYEEEMPSLIGVKEANGIEEKVRFINQELRLPKNRDGYFSPPPLISDLLAFIASHPKLEGVELLQIDYELKSYPTLDHPQTKYDPRVRILFSSNEAVKAREFHDAIVEEGGFVNIDAEIEWNRKGSEYEIAFFLQV